MATDSFLRRLLKENVVLLVVAMLVTIPVLMPFTHGNAGRAFRNGLFQALGIVLLLVLLARLDFRGGRAQVISILRSGVNAPLAVLLLWAALGAVRTGGSPDQPFATAELLRLGAGSLIYLAVALHLETRAQLALLIDCLLGIVLLGIGYGLIFQDSESARGVSAIIPNPHHLSAILTVLFPLLISLAFGVEERIRRMAAIAAAVLCGAGLLVCLERSAWAAAAVGLLVWLGLASQFARTADIRRRWRAMAAVTATGLLVAVGFFGATRLDASVSARVRDISLAVQGRDDSFAWRVQKWRGAAGMAVRRPVWGWGPGQFVLQQYPYTHLGWTEAEVRKYGASFEAMAYNEYLQTAAELGLPGLALYLLLLASFFSKAARALLRLPEGLRRTVLLGCMGGIAAQMIDAMANGSWRYAECAIFFWLVLGLGVAVIRMAYQAPAGTPPQEI